MALSYAQALRRDIDKLKFAKEQIAKKAPKKPKKKERTPATELIIKGGKNIKLQIRQAASGLFQVQMTYRKDTTNEIKSYRVAPYSYRSRKTKKGIRLMLFAYDMDDEHIKGFVLRNVIEVKILAKKRFRPKWPVEIA